jgi:MFS transporter, putative metabolite:H+ symporter
MSTRVLDELPLSRFHWKLLLTSGFGWMFDAMDILVVASVVAAVAKEWGLDATQSQWINTANVGGLFFGALAAGWLADRHGRKLVFQLTLLVYSIFTGLAAASTGLAMLMVLRFCAGLGLGGELPVASTLVSEFSPAKRRGTIVVLLESFWAYGAVLAALLGYLVIPNLGWRAVFLMGALPALYVFVLRRNLPESPRYLESRGRHEEAAAVVRQVAEQSGVVVPPEKLLAEGSAVAKRTSIADLVAPAYLRRTIALWVMWATINFSYYGIFLWLPSQFVRKGFSLDQALQYNLIIALAQIPGYFTAAYFVERWGRKTTLVVYLLGSAVGAFFFGQVALAAKDVNAILLWGSIISFFNLGAWGVIYTYTPEMYPTSLRGTGAGWAAAVGRVFAFLAPLSVSLLIALFGADEVVFLAFAAVMVVGGLVVWAIGPETRGKSLEQLTA